MLDDENVPDLMLSIGQKGYFEGEPLLVIPNGSRFTVVEGNRRLTAVKLLNGQLEPPKRRARSVGTIIDEAAVAPTLQLPCLVYESRKDILRYLGYRHITGIKEWDALSKAKYLHQLREEFYKDLPKSDQLRGLAKDIGSRADYVGLLLTALSLYVSAENATFYGLPVKTSDVEFSLITTALGYKKIAKWLGLDSGTDVDAEGLNEDNLRLLFGWMFAKDQLGRTILGDSRNLGELADVVGSEDALTHFLESEDLKESYQFTDGPTRAISNAIDNATGWVNVAWTLVGKKAPLVSAQISESEKLFEQTRALRNAIRDAFED